MLNYVSLTINAWMVLYKCAASLKFQSISLNPFPATKQAEACITPNITIHLNVRVNSLLLQAIHI